MESKQGRTSAGLPGASDKNRSRDMLLAVLAAFSSQGRSEVSLSEFQQSVAELQREFSLGYTFSERFLLSPDLLADLKELDYRGYVQDYRYRLDHLLPKRFISLTVLGRGRGKKVQEGLPPTMAESIMKAVKLAIKDYSDRWRLWARPTV